MSEHGDAFQSRGRRASWARAFGTPVRFDRRPDAAYNRFSWRAQSEPPPDLRVRRTSPVPARALNRPGVTAPTIAADIFDWRARLQPADRQGRGDDPRHQPENDLQVPGSRPSHFRIAGSVRFRGSRHCRVVALASCLNSESDVPPSCTATLLSCGLV